MAEQAETLQKKIKDVLDETVGLDTEIAHINVLINENRAKLGGANASRHNNSSIDKQVRVLENRLEKALVKFNKGLAVNKRLRVIINNLRRERLVFDNVYHKFEKGLLDQKKSMADIIETSNAAYEARDEAQTKVIGLREKAEKEYQNYVQEIKELDRALEHDRRLKEFMATKTAHRTLTMSAQKGSKKEKETVSSGSADEDNFTVSLDTYENAFMKIRKVTGISDIGELVERFKQVEDKNFSLFNYVSEVNNEIELSAEETLELVAKIDKLKIEEVTQEEMRKQELHKFEKQLQEFTDKKKVCAEKNEEMAIISGELTKGIESLIKNLQETARQKPTIGSVQATAATGEDGDVTVEPPVISKRSERLRQMIDFEMPSDNLGESGVSEENLVQFLGLIEQKSNELLTLNYICNSPRKVQQLVEGEIQGVGGLLGQGPGAPIGNFTIVAPGTGYYLINLAMTMILAVMGQTRTSAR